jgi:flagellin
MTIDIISNSSALFSQSALTYIQRNTDSVMEKLSTGYRINSAKDDAAGLAISQKMTAQIRGFEQALRNINDGISLIQTADGGMAAIGDMLQRIRELSIQSSSSTNSNDQRAFMQQEVNALQQQINSIANTTQWNGRNIIDGSFTGQKIQIGSNINDSMNISIPSATTSALGMGSTTTYGQFVVQFAYSGSTPVMYNARLNTNTGQLLSSVDSAWASGADETLKTSIRLSDFSYAGNGTGHGHITIAPDGMIPNQTVNIDYSGDVNPWNAIYVDYQYTDGVYTIRNVGSNSGMISSITATFNSGGITATNPNYIPVDISTSASASASILVIDTALNTVNNTRATMGSYINRLNFAADNANNISLNLSKSRSTIQDTDYARESATLARNQIIQKAATAMLAQANQQPQSVLELLKNL